MRIIHLTLMHKYILNSKLYLCIISGRIVLTKWSLGEIEQICKSGKSFEMAFYVKKHSSTQWVH